MTFKITAEEKQLVLARRKAIKADEEYDEDLAGEVEIMADDFVNELAKFHKKHKKKFQEAKFQGGLEDLIDKYSGF